MAVSGDLRDMDLVSIISINCNEMNQGRLLVRHQGREASVFFEEGHIVHMSLGSLEGEQVIQEIMGWEEGTFELEQGVLAPRRTVTTSWSELLLKGMQQLDESASVESPVERPLHIGDRNGDDRMGPTKKGEDAELANGDGETGAQTETELAAGAPELKGLAETLFHMGLNHGLTPREAALEAGKTELPSFIADAGRKEFKQWLVQVYQESLRDQVAKLREDMGFDRVANHTTE